MYCQKCGKQIDDNAKFCIYCGTPVTGNAAVSEAAPSEYNAPTEPPVTSSENAQPQETSTVNKIVSELPKRGKHIPVVGIAAAAILVAVLGVLLLVRGGTGGQNRLAGVYESADGDVYTFAKDGTYRLYNNNSTGVSWGTYQVEGRDYVIFENCVKHSYIKKNSTLQFIFENDVVKTVDFDGKKIADAPSTVRPSNDLVKESLWGEYINTADIIIRFFDDGTYEEVGFDLSHNHRQTTSGVYTVDDGVLAVTVGVTTEQYLVSIEGDKIFLYYYYDPDKNSGTGKLYFRASDGAEEAKESSDAEISEPIETEEIIEESACYNEESIEESAYYNEEFIEEPTVENVTWGDVITMNATHNDGSRFSPYSIRIPQAWIKYYKMECSCELIDGKEIFYSTFICTPAQGYSGGKLFSIDLFDSSLEYDAFIGSGELIGVITIADGTTYNLVYSPATDVQFSDSTQEIYENMAMYTNAIIESIFVEDDTQFLRVYGQ